MIAYLFKAAYWCEDCIRNYLKAKDEVMLAYPDWYSGGSHLIRTEDMFREYITASGHDPDDEAGWDSDKLPKGPYGNGGGKADTPQHCDCCGCFLENPLTRDGYAYLIDRLTDADGDPDVEAKWLAFYGSDHYEGKTIIEHLK